MHRRRSGDILRDAVNGRAPGARPRPPPPPRTAEYGWDKRGSAERSSEESEAAVGAAAETKVGYESEAAERSV